MEGANLALAVERRTVLRQFSRPLIRTWNDGRHHLVFLTPLGLRLFDLWCRTPLRSRWPRLLRYSIDYNYKGQTPDDGVIGSALKDYEQALSQRAEHEWVSPLSVQWSDYVSNLTQNFRPELIRDFRRNRLCIGGYCGSGVILDEDIEVREMSFTDGYTVARNHIYRQQWGSAQESRFALRRIREFHQIGPSVDPGVLANADEDNVGSPILPVHQGKHLSNNILRYAYFITNILRHCRVPSLCDRFVVCEIGGGYGGFAKLFRKTYRQACYIDFDLPESIVLATYYLKANFPNARFLTVQDVPQGKRLDRESLLEYDFILLPWWYIEFVAPCTVDFFFNSSSMQEMPRQFVDYYVGHIQRTASGYFYWINRAIAPQRYGGSRFVDYPLDGNWRTVYTKSGDKSPVALHEWMAVRTD